MLFNLDLRNILDKDNFQVVAQLQDPEQLTVALLVLHSIEMLNDETRKFVAQHQDPKQLAIKLGFLKKDSILQENFNCLANYLNNNVLLLVKTFVDVVDADVVDAMILNKQISSGVSQHELSLNLFKALNNLNLQEDDYQQILSKWKWHNTQPRRRSSF